MTTVRSEPAPAEPVTESAKAASTAAPGTESKAAAPVAAGSESAGAAAVASESAGAAAASESAAAGSVAGEAAGWTPEAPSSRASSAYLALGYLCFSTTLFILAVFHAGLVSFNFIVAVFPTAIFFGGVAQFIAGIWAYSQRNFFAAVTFTSFAAFWLSYSLYTWLFLPQLVANFGNSVTAATGSFTLAWGLVALFATIAARRVNRAVFGLLSLTTLMYLFITIGQYAVAPPVDLVGGVFALVAALLGLYVGAAYLINGSYRRVVLPLGEPRS